MPEVTVVSIVGSFSKVKLEDKYSRHLNIWRDHVHVLLVRCQIFQIGKTKTKKIFGCKLNSILKATVSGTVTEETFALLIFCGEQ